MPPRVLGSAIIQLFEEAQTRVYSRKDLVEILAESRRNETLPRTTTFEEFVEFLSKHGLKKTTLLSDQYPAITKYCWQDPSPFELGASLRPGSYLSHGTAVFLHGLTDQFPATIYSNKEQSEKPQQSRSSLTQEGIDRAFKNKQRESAYILKEGRWRFVLLSGKHTNRLEVGSIAGPSRERVEATKLERTLIDITVRPTYAGGVFEVRRAYENAKDRVSTNVLLATLKKLGYVYPYHQAIGFYMERAGYSPDALDRVSALGIDFDFHLAHGPNNTELDPRWRLFHPQGF